MDLYAPIVRHLLHPLWVKKNGSRLYAYLAEYERSQYWSPDEVSALQWARVTRLLDYAYEQCPFYRHRFIQSGIHPKDIKTPEDFLKLPPLNKSDIQEHLHDVIAQPALTRALIKDMTGGSTGSPLVFYYDRDRRDSRDASRIRHNRWAGWKIGDKVAALWGRERQTPSRATQWRRRLLSRQLLLDASALTERTMRDFVHRLNTLRPTIVLAYANMADLLASFIEQHGLRLRPPAGVVTTAEVLTPEKRQRIERAFQCKVFNRYGSREVALIASECEQRRGLHINAESLYVELMHDGRPADPGELGEVYITDLLNYSMPLIRYRIGDVARRPATPRCPCGRGLPMLTDIEGRVTDFLITPDRRIVSGVALATYMITNIKGIRQIQLVQEHPCATTIRLVKHHDFDDQSEAELKRRAAEFLGHQMAITISAEEHIPNEPSGKFRFSISRVAPFPEVAAR